LRCFLFSFINESSSSVISGHCNRSALKFLDGAPASSFEGQIRTSTSSAVKVSGNVNINWLPLRLIRVFLTVPLGLSFNKISLFNVKRICTVSEISKRVLLAP
jgi:hypothetical protein